MTSGDSSPLVVSQGEREAAAETSLPKMNQLLKNLYLDRMERLCSQDTRQTFPIGDVEVFIQERAGLALGSHVWDCSLQLSKHIIKNFPRNAFANKNLIELGAGCGLLGICLSKYTKDQNTKVYLTDKNEMLPLLRDNLILNELDKNKQISSVELEWENGLGALAGQTFDFIVAADVVFNERLFEPLIQTIVALSHPHTTLLLAYTKRDRNEDEFFQELSKYFDARTLHRVPSKLRNSKVIHKEVVIFTMKRKRYSII